MASMMFSHLEECTKKNAVGAFICLVEGCSFSTSTHRYLRRHQSRRHAHLSVGVRTTPRRLGKKPQAPNKKLKDQNKGLLEPKKIFQRPKRKVSQQLRKLPQVQTKKLQEPSEKSKISKKNLQEPSKKSKKIKKEPQAPQAMNPIQTCILNVGRCWTCGCFIKTNRKKCDYCLGLKERPAKVYTKRAKMAIIQEGGKSAGAMRKKSHKKIAVKKVKVKINPEPESNNQQERMGGRVEPPMPKLQREEYTTAPIEKKSIVSMNVEEIMNLLNVDEDSSYVSLKDVVENLGTDE